MAKGTPIDELAGWRNAAGLTMEQAAARIVVDGKAATRGTWHAWESGRKVPKYEQMLELTRVTGVSPKAFYGDPPPRPTADKRQPALL